MRLFLIIPAVLMIFMACPPANNTVSTDSTAAPTISAEPKEKGGITIAELDKKYADFEKAYFAGGCFWCTEAAFHRINGVQDVYSGYSGGAEKDPTYREVASGKTTHAESIVVYYDPEVVSYNTLLDVFFYAHDPTTLNRQGPDVGPHYRSAIFFLSPEQEKAAIMKIKELDANGTFQNPIVTQVQAAGAFYVAEGYHQDYYEDFTNPNQSYVQNITRPKVEKVMKRFADILKPEFKKKP